MTKQELKWRLAELPTGDDVAQLVEKKVITTKEARDILFNEDKPASTKVKELEEEVKFLRELCDKLAAKSNGWTTIIKEIEVYKPKYPVWYSSYTTLGSPIYYSANTGTITTTGASAVGVAVNTTEQPKQLLSKLN